MNRICDLHTHSNRSDGSLSPTELVVEAKKKGVAALALTDHNTTKGLAEFLEAGKTLDMIAVPGCEFSTDYGRNELHVVGLFLPEPSWPMVERYVDALRREKHKSNLTVIEKLRERGVAITYEEVAALTDAEEFNRAHVARTLLAKGYVHSLNQAFDTVLKEGNGCYFPAKRPDVFDTLRFIRQLGGVPVLAHPFLNLDHWKPFCRWQKRPDFWRWRPIIPCLTRQAQKKPKRRQNASVCGKAAVRIFTAPPSRILR